MGSRLYVGNIPFNTDETQLRAFFEEGNRQVASVKIIMDRETGRPRGFAFVDMATDEEAQAAITAFHGKEFGGRTLTVNEARERQPGERRDFDRGPRPGGYSGGYSNDNRGGGGYSNDNRGGGYSNDNRGGGFSNDDRGNRGGYSNDNRGGGGYNNDNRGGGFSNDRGGYGNRDSRGGGGFSNDRGGFNNDNRGGGGFGEDRGNRRNFDRQNPRNRGGGYERDRGRRNFDDDDDAY